MKFVSKGIIAGFVATIVLSILMVTKGMMGLMPSLNVIKMLSAMMGSPGTPVVGWAAHFMIGTIGYGIAMVIFASVWSMRSRTLQGLILAATGWVVMMVAIMPMAGAGLFGLHMGMAAPVMTLVLHVIFGIVLGWTYGRLVPLHQHVVGSPA